MKNFRIVSCSTIGFGSDSFEALGNCKVIETAFQVVLDNWRRDSAGIVYNQNLCIVRG